MDAGGTELFASRRSFDGFAFRVSVDFGGPGGGLHRLRAVFGGISEAWGPVAAVVSEIFGGSNVRAGFD